MHLIDKPSPNFGERRGGDAVTMLVLHYTDMETAEAAITRLRDPEAEVSAHYLIDEAGRIYALVKEGKRAWHAGVSFWDGERDVNSRSIGIELANPGHTNGYCPFPEVQMNALRRLATDIISRHGIEPRNVVGHSDIAPGRKIDPGELFDWRWLAEEGIGLWPQPGAAGDAGIETLLGAIGYDPETPLDDRVSAFQRRFRPSRIDGQVDEETLALAAGMAAACYP